MPPEAAAPKPDGVSIDSRTLQRGQLFVAIRGKRYDGHDFAAEAISKGAAGVVVERWPLPGVAPRQEIQVSVVPDTLAALGNLARAHRDHFQAPVVAVTGSSGKSTTKTMLAHLLSEGREILATPGTQNNRIGVPLTLFRLHARHRFVVLELGANQWGEIRTLAQISRPQVGVLTNIGPAHLETFGDLDGVLRAKGELWEEMQADGALALNADDPLLWEAGHQLRQKVVWFGCRPQADLRASRISSQPSGSSCLVNDRWALRLPMPGRHNLMNALAALSAAWVLGEEVGRAASRLESCPSLPGRLSLAEHQGVLVMDDSYNANPASVRAALEVLAGVQRSGRKIVVLGDMLELGMQSEDLHREAGRWLAQSRVDLLLAVGPGARLALAAAWEEGLPSECGRAFPTPEEAGEHLLGWARPGDTVLLKGSRGMQMERVLECFITSSTH